LNKRPNIFFLSFLLFSGFGLEISISFELFLQRPHPSEYSVPFAG